jgi:hypothetical protein
VLKRAKIGAPNETKERSIARVFIHPDYDSTTFLNNIALLKLDVSALVVLFLSVNRISGVTFLFTLETGEL